MLRKKIALYRLSRDATSISSVNLVVGRICITITLFIGLLMLLQVFVDTTGFVDLFLTANFQSSSLSSTKATTKSKYHHLELEQLPQEQDDHHHSQETLSNKSDLLWKDVCTQESVINLSFCNISLSINDRVSDYIQRIPIKSMIQMMGNVAAAYEPLYIPSYQWWSEGLHGPNQLCILNHITNNYTCPTSFPCPAGIGTTFNNTLYYAIGSVIGKEGRAFSNIRNHYDYRITNDGLAYWSPVINMQRDPRWGRNQEVPSEDPYHTSQYAYYYVIGLQQQQQKQSTLYLENKLDNMTKKFGNKRIDYTYNTDDPEIQIGACCKHYIANSLERWNNITNRHIFDAIVSDDVLNDYYLVPFEKCIKDANAVGIMCSYNSINGIPSCANDKMLNDIVRTQWNFTGYITSDCGAIDDIYVYHNYTNNPYETVAVSINATTDVDCGRYYQTYLYDALNLNLVEQTTIIQSFTRLVTVQMQLGLFDNNKNKSTYSSYGFNNIDTPEHQQLALEAAQQSIVLLKNSNNTLPFMLSSSSSSSSIIQPKTIAVIGPHHNATGAFLSSYHGDRCTNGRSNVHEWYDDDSKTYDCIETPIQAIRKINVHGTTTGVAGCAISDTSWNDITSAVQLAKTSDIIILMMGLDRTQEAEELDRVETTIPGLQVKLIESILALNKSNVVLVLLNGGSLSLGPTIINNTPAILDIYYGGQYASQALVDVLFDGKFNPVGKLAATMYPSSYVHDIPLTEMNTNVGIGRTYLYYNGIPEYQFGHGLSYSNWSLSWYAPNNGKDIIVNSPFIDYKTMIQRLQLNITNCGPYSGSQTILVFKVSTQAEYNDTRRRSVLIGYGGTKQVLHPGQSEIISIDVTIENLLFPSVTTAKKFYNTNTYNNSSSSRLQDKNNFSVTLKAIADDKTQIYQTFRFVVRH